MKTHREIAEQLDLFHSEPQAPGMIFWHPNGWRLFESIKSHMRSVYHRSGFQEVNTPVFMKQELWKKSGHIDMFSENMFFGGSQEQQSGYVLKPMSCPAHILLYKRGVHSHKDLPIKLFEFGLVHRNESSGSLNGCLRARQFTQDDAHVFCQWKQAEDEVRQFLQRARKVYGAYGYEHIEVKVSTKPEKALGDDEDWIRAQDILVSACIHEKFHTELQDGEGAFYGPKIELSLTDSMGRSWQCGTIQFDFNLAKRFDVKFTSEEGNFEAPVIMHQAMYGSVERWIGILLEMSQGDLPLWLHPQPVAIASVNHSNCHFAKIVADRLLDIDIHALLDLSKSSMGRKMKRFHKKKIPFVISIGDYEVENGVVSIKNRKEASETQVSMEHLAEYILSSLQ
ncbi:threonine--tRNA ligase [Vibrio splendidus]|jgi:threonyl-tRNA synthetase|uniref:threonine--tRNA ligase n=1 Tax=Vibrio splendidus TaxID=29497 RepID=UPI000C85FC2A|nr:threonine--tRNA ligase [Vibrio splendidus]PMN15580.1 threonine--tRNA ligase [Vibrio splendidus]